MSGVNLSSVGPPKRRPGAPGRHKLLRHVASRVAALALLTFTASAFSQSSDSLLAGRKPPDASGEEKQIVGIYLSENSKHSFVLLERGGKLYWRDGSGKDWDSVLNGNQVFLPSEGGKLLGYSVSRDNSGNVTGFCHLNSCYVRTDPGARREPASHVSTPRPIEQLRGEALAASPPEENRNFRSPDLVELAPLDHAIHLDIRYATANDFLGAPVYTEARAFLQRPAAESLLRVLRKLQPLGYGLLIYDGYRPWYVTKIFWDATPAEGKIFVADPAEGSRHNRGCAVDLTLYDLKTGQPVEMTGNYDEMSPRSFPSYPGGTSLERWHRDLLRRAMESEGFTVYESEWWHFDYKDWHEYGILNIPFEKLGAGSATK